MTLSSTKLVPEIQYYFSQFIKGSTLNENLTLFPEEMNILYLYDNKSFIRLLFDETFSNNEYKYLYRKTLRTEWPESVSIRLSLFPSSGEYYLCDSTSCDINLFNLEEDDFTMLNILLTYRLTPLFANIQNISYNDLSTNLSKLIYIYLDLKLNNSIIHYDDLNLISNSNSVLEIIYENYIIEEVFKYLQSKQIIQPQV